MSSSNVSGMSDQGRAHLDTSQGAKAAHPPGRPDPVVSHRTTGSHDTAKNLEMQLVGSAAKLQAACNPEDTAPGAKRSTTVAKNPVFRTPKVDEYPTLRIMKAYQKFGKQYVDGLRRDPNCCELLRITCDIANASPDLLPDFPG